jgi:hypothetical protein
LFTYLKDGNIIQRSSGVIPPARVLVLMDAAGRILRAGKFLRSLQISALFYENGNLSFMDGIQETRLEEHQKKELRFILTARMLGEDLPVFRAGRIRLRETEPGTFIFGFGRNEKAISLEDVGILWAVCAGENRRSGE